MIDRRLILAVSAGPLRGRKAVLRPGESVRVGRSLLADFSFPQDRQLSAKHFELQWDGALSLVRDLKSIGGTLLNGAAVAEAEVPHGGWIRAGETDFTVHVEARTPPSEDDDDEEDDDEGDDGEADPAGGAGGAREEVYEAPFPAEDSAPDEGDDAIYAYMDEEQRWDARQAARQGRTTRATRDEAVTRALPILTAAAEREPLHAILDAARSPRIREVLSEGVEEHRSLYEGVQGEALDDVAPYLVSFKGESRLLRQLISEGWARRWGIFAEGAVPLRPLRRHLRRFLMVEDDKTRERLYFRYYDPGVLRAFWPTCSRRQLEELIGPFRAFLVEGERGEVLRLTPDGKAEPWAGPS